MQSPVTRVSQIAVVKSPDDSELDEDAVEQSGTPADREQQHDSQQHLDHLRTSHTPVDIANENVPIQLAQCRFHHSFRVRFD